ncbi:MAG: hypothetical protein ISS47_02535 [Candidatus Omnitrophica bacterium]|nr:hypothetical protein [Candidatus Omnitrophota bacterium]
MTTGFKIKKEKPYIYIAYKSKNSRREKSISKIADVLRNFGCYAWWDKEKENKDWPSRCGQAMNDTNEFLLVAHKDTHKDTPSGNAVMSLEIPGAINKYKRKEYKRIIVLVMEKKVSMSDYRPFAAFMDIFPRISKYRKGWSEKLRKIFETEETSVEKLLNLVKSEDSRSQIEAKALIENLLGSKKLQKPIDLQKGLLLLLRSYSEKETRDKILEAIDLLKKKIANKRPLKPSILEKPNSKQLQNHKRMHESIKSEYSAIVNHACKLYEGLIYLLKGFNLKDEKTRNKIIKLLGISPSIEKAIIDKLLKFKIIEPAGDTIWFKDDNLGKKIMQEVFFGKHPLIKFSKIERLFYGKD